MYPEVIPGYREGEKWSPIPLSTVVNALGGQTTIIKCRKVCVKQDRRTSVMNEVNVFCKLL